MVGATIFLAIVLLVIAGGAVYGILRVRRSVRDISRMAFGTDSFMEGLEQQEILMEETPKSVAGMTNMCLPRIEKNFTGRSGGSGVRRCLSLICRPWTRGISPAWKVIRRN